MRNKVILVMGASSGIGRAVSIKLANEGAKVILAARSTQALETLKHTIQENGGECFVQACNICSEEDVNTLISDTIGHFGKIDVAVLCSGIQYTDKVSRLDTSEVDAMFQTNVIGIIRCARFILPHMIQRNKGQIVFISSIMGEAAFPHMVSYGATKAAISCFARGLRREVWGQGITIQLFSPGHMNTNISTHLQDRIPPWYGKSGALNIDDVAEKWVRAIKQKRSEIIVGRQTKMLSHMIKYLPFFANNIIRKITT